MLRGKGGKPDSPTRWEKLEWGRLTRECTTKFCQVLDELVKLGACSAQEGLRERPGHWQTPHQPHFATGYAKGNRAFYVSSCMCVLGNSQQDISADNKFPKLQVFSTPRQNAFECLWMEKLIILWTVFLMQSSFARSGVEGKRESPWRKGPDSATLPYVVPIGQWVLMSSWPQGWYCKRMSRRFCPVCSQT